MDLLLAELTKRTGRRVVGNVDVIASHLPLIHRTSYPEKLLQDANLQPASGGPCRTELGLDGHTFFWVGTSAYDDWNVSLVWEAYAETQQPEALAAPWDTGGLCQRSLGQPVADERARELLAQYSLPAPSYRAYLAATIECCFEDVTSYLGCSAPNWYPGWVIPRAFPPCPPHHTFELRRSGPVAIEQGLVAVVALESWFVDQPQLLRRLKSWASKNEADWIAVDESRERPPQTLARLVRRYLSERDLLT